MKYRKHVLVDAIQLSKDNYRLVERFSQGTAYPANVRVSNGRTAVKEVYIRRHKEPQLVKLGDWVVRDENGEFYACSNDVFVRHYHEWEGLNKEQKARSVQEVLDAKIWGPDLSSKMESARNTE